MLQTAESGSRLEMAVKVRMTQGPRVVSRLHGSFIMFSRRVDRGTVVLMLVVDIRAGQSQSGPRGLAWVPPNLLHLLLVNISYPTNICFY